MAQNPLRKAYADVSPFVPIFAFAEMKMLILRESEGLLPVPRTSPPRQCRSGCHGETEPYPALNISKITEK